LFFPRLIITKYFIHQLIVKGLSDLDNFSVKEIYE